MKNPNNKSPSPLIKFLYPSKIIEPNFNTTIILEILNKKLKPNKTCVVYTSDHIFKILQETYIKYFSNNKSFKVLRSTTLLDDVTNTTEQEQIINK